MDSKGGALVSRTPPLVGPVAAPPSIRTSFISDGAPLNRLPHRLSGSAAPVPGVRLRNCSICRRPVPETDREVMDRGRSRYNFAVNGVLPSALVVLSRGDCPE